MEIILNVQMKQQTMFKDGGMLNTDKMEILASNIVQQHIYYVLSRGVWIKWRVNPSEACESFFIYFETERFWF